MYNYLQDLQNEYLVNDSEDGEVWNDFRPSAVSTSDAPSTEEGRLRNDTTACL